MKEVNYIKHLNRLFEQFAKDNRLNPTHISLYIALFQLWNLNRFKATFYINRDEVMQLSKIGSKSTYHRCIKELSYWKYIVYHPSHNPYKGSKINMTNFGTSTGQVVVHNSSQMETNNKQALVPIYKHIQTIENKQFNKPENYKNEKNENSGLCHFEHVTSNEVERREISKTKKPHPQIQDNYNFPSLNVSPLGGQGADNLKVTKNKNYNEPL